MMAGRRGHRGAGRATIRQYRCERCEVGIAEWAWQPGLKHFYVLGWHARGFAVVKVCDDCQNTMRKEPRS